MFIGLYVEKGLPVPRRWGGVPAQAILGANWIWHKFIRDMADGGLSEAVHEPVSLQVSVSELDQTSVSGRVNEQTWKRRLKTIGQSQWTVRGGKLADYRQTEDGSTAKRLSEIATLSDLGKTFQTWTSSDDWVVRWIDVLIGIHCRLRTSSDAPTQSSAWGLSELLKYGVEPWHRWLEGP